MLKQLIHRGLKRAGLKLVKNYQNQFDLELYGDCTKLLNQPRFINVGSGNFYHPCWFNLDKANEFYREDQSANPYIEHDLTSGNPLPFESNSVEIFYCSHVIEHLPNQAVKNLLSEFQRCLKPGGLFRISCPDMELQYKAYFKSDILFWPDPSPWGTSPSSLEIKLVEHFATLLVMPERVANPTKRLAEDEIKALIKTTTMEEFFNTVNSLLPKDSNQILPEGHCNWFSEDKLIDMAKDLKGLDCKASRYGQSADARLRNTDLFDKTCPELSLYVEGFKI